MLRFDGDPTSECNGFLSDVTGVWPLEVEVRGQLLGKPGGVLR